MSLATDILAQVAPAACPNYVDAFGDQDGLLAHHDITTPLRVAHFVAQVMHETNGGTMLTENLSYTTAPRLMEIFGLGRHSAAVRSDEAPRLLNNAPALAERVYGLGNPSKAQELGNTKPGDGFKYRGRGALQTTGGANYRRASMGAGVDFYAEPDLILAGRHALKPALRTWSDGNLNAAADRNDIQTITKVINGGLVGFEERSAWFDKIWPLASGDKAAWQAAVPDDDTLWLQHALNDLNARPILVVDGLMGPATTEAIKWIQAFLGLDVDGIAGEETRAAIRRELATVRGG